MRVWITKRPLQCSAYTRLRRAKLHWISVQRRRTCCVPAAVRNRRALCEREFSSGTVHDTNRHAHRVKDDSGSVNWGHPVRNRHSGPSAFPSTPYRPSARRVGGYVRGGESDRHTGDDKRMRHLKSAAIFSNGSHSKSVSSGTPGEHSCPNGPDGTSNCFAARLGAARSSTAAKLFAI